MKNENAKGNFLNNEAFMKPARAENNGF